MRQLYASFLPGQARYEANVDLATLSGEAASMRAVARYVFGKFSELQRVSGTRVLLVMDAPRDSIYLGRDPHKAEAYHLNQIARDAATAADLDLIDLTPYFERDYAEHHTRFEFPHDGHWNSRAHRVAADAVSSALRPFVGSRSSTAPLTIVDPDRSGQATYLGDPVENPQQPNSRHRDRTVK